MLERRGLVRWAAVMLHSKHPQLSLLLLRPKHHVVQVDCQIWKPCKRKTQHSV